MTSETKSQGTKKRTDIENIREGILESELQQFSVASLRKFCKQHSLDSTGNVEQLVSRVFRHLIVSGSTKENLPSNLNEKTSFNNETKTTHGNNKNYNEVKKSALSSQPRKRKKGGVKFSSKDLNHGNGDDDDDDVNSIITSVHYFSKSDPPARNFYDVLNAIDENDEESPPKRHHITESPVKVSEMSKNVVQGFSIFDETLPMEKTLLDTEQLTSAELTEELSKRGLSTSGTKKEKLFRLESYLSQQMGLDVTKSKTYQTQRIKSPPKWLKWR